MSFFSFILAQAENGAEEAGALSSRLITLGAYAAVIMIVLIWTIFVRKQRNKRRHVHRRKPHTWQMSEDEKPHRHHRRRRSKHPELPRNPSLADGEGLPPRRPDDVLPPGP